MARRLLLLLALVTACADDSGPRGATETNVMPAPCTTDADCDGGTCRPFADASDGGSVCQAADD